MADEMSLIRSLLLEAGLEVKDLPSRRGVLGEDDLRVVLAVLFETPQALLEGWEQEQAWFVERISEARVDAEKSWDLYLVLACAQQASPLHSPMLDKIRRDVSLTRKLVVPGVATSDPARVSSLMAPLRFLPAQVAGESADAIAIVRQEAMREEREDVVGVIDRFRKREPLLPEG